MVGFFGSCISFNSIEIVFQRDLWWWSRRQILSFIQLLSSFQSFNFYNTMGWKCSLKSNCCGSCAPSFVSLGSCTSLGSVLVLVLRVRLRCVPHLSVLCSGSWSCLGHPQPPWRTRHGCTVGVNRDPPVCSRCPGSMASVAERQPYVRWRRATISRRRGL